MVTDAPERYFVVDSPYEVARWRPLVHWILYIPHGIVLYVLQIIAGVVALVYWLTLVFTGRLHRGMYGIITMYERYNVRATSFLIGYSEQYPPFDIDMGPRDNTAYPPIRLDLPEPPESTPRTAAFNWFLAIPHYVVLVVLWIGAAVIAVIAWFAVLFTGVWPRGMRDWLVRLTNYYYRVWTYVVMVDTSYPKFGLPPT